MKRKLLFSTAITALFALMIIGCQKAPELELTAAKAAVDSARVAGADKYLPSEFSTVEDTLKAAISEIEKQKSGNPLTVNYARAITLLTTTANSARQLTSQSLIIHQKALADIDSSLSKATSLLTEVKEMFTNVQSNKKNKLPLDTIANNLSAVELSLGEIAKVKSEGNPDDVQSKLTNEITALDSIKVKLTTKPAVTKAKK